MFSKTFNRVLAVAAPALLLATSNAHAAAMTLPAEITDAALSVAVIGAGVFAIYVAIKLWKWVKGAL